MARFLGFFLLLLPVYAAGRIAVGLLFFRRLDLRFVTFCEVLFVPAFQAALFCALEPGSGRFRKALEEAGRSRAVVAVAAANVLLVGLAVFQGAGGWPRAWLRPAAALQIAAAALFLLPLVARGGHPRRDRVALAAGAVALSVWSAATFSGGLSDLSDRMLPSFPQVLRWLTLYGALFAALVGVLLWLGRSLDRQSVAAGLLVELGVAFAFAAGAIVVPNVFLRPIVPEPWATAALACALVSSGSVLAAVIQAHSDVRNAPSRAFAPSAPA